MTLFLLPLKQQRDPHVINTVSVPILSNSIMNSLWQKIFIHLSVVLQQPIKLVSQ